jgi:hypothetical protein
MSGRLDIAMDVRGGDVCNMFCPGELGDTARAAGVRHGVLEVAWGGPGTGGEPAAIIVAIRVRGVPARRLVDGWIAARVGEPGTVDLRLGGKPVTLVWTGLIPDAFNTRYLYARADVLFMVLALPVADDPRRPDEVVIEAFRALP